MASRKSANSWLGLLLLAFCLHLVIVSTAEDVTKKDSVKAKKPIGDKKADLKNEKKTGTLLKGTVESVTLPSDTFNTTFEEDDEFENMPIWKMENNTIMDNVTTVNLVSDERYFISRTIRNETLAMAYWVNTSALPKHQQFTHEVLSDSHRRAASINLPFAFPFYGQPVKKATIATGGFLYMGEHVHSWLAATQYIAPLMANFDTRNSTDSNVIYAYNNSLFVIEWHNVRLQEKPEAEFTFQCVLHSNGDIAFVYKDLPIGIDHIPDSGHPVKIGVSDAYFINKAHVYVRRKTIYEYHKLDMINSTAKFLSNRTAIYLEAKPTCSTLKTCESCLLNHTGFDCVWCPSVKRCSDGFDRSRQEWISKECDHTNSSIVTASQCPAVKPLASTTEHPLLSSTPFSANSNHSASDSHDSKNIDLPNDKSNLTQLEYNTHEKRISNNIPSNSKNRASGHSGVALTLFFLLSIVAGVGLWGFYAYRNPTSSSGQLLIRWRPSAWRWNSAETRYTAASIHM